MHQIIIEVTCSDHAGEGKVLPHVVARNEATSTHSYSQTIWTPDAYSYLAKKLIICHELRDSLNCMKCR